MTLEVSDCTASSNDFEIDKTPFEPKTETPKGLISVPDSMMSYPTPPKPGIIKRTIINIALLFIHGITWTIQLTNWALKTFFNYGSRQKTLYRELHHLSKKGEMGKVQEFLVEHSEDAFPSAYLFSEFNDLTELHIHLAEILQGANLSICNDGGFFCRRWSEHPDCYRRLSSHQYQGDECYAIGHFLFWLDLEGNTRFQFENSQFRGFFSAINHIIDYLRYRRDNEQQGVTGTSPYTEEYCIKVEVDLPAFISRKVEE